MVEQAITGTTAPASAPAVAHGHPVNLLKVLGPGHVWALGVGIVLVGEFMGWNFSVAKGGALGALIACWVIGLLYTCVAMIDSEVTSTVAAAGGQYAQAKHIVGPLMAFNVGLYLVMASSMVYAMTRKRPTLKAIRGPTMCFAWAYCPPAAATVDVTSESIMATQV